MKRAASNCRFTRWDGTCIYLCIYWVNLSRLVYNRSTPAELIQHRDNRAVYRFLTMHLRFRFIKCFDRNGHWSVWWANVLSKRVHSPSGYVSAVLSTRMQARALYFHVVVLVVVHSQIKLCWMILFHLIWSRCACLFDTQCDIARRVDCCFVQYTGQTWTLLRTTNSLHYYYSTTTSKQNVSCWCCRLRWIWTKWYL